MSRSLSRKGNLYYLFGAPGSTACATAAKDQHTVPVKGQWCYLAGLNGDPTIADLQAETLPAGVTFSEGKVLTVPQGWVVLQAANPTPTDTIKPTSPNAEFFVLKDQPALNGTQISNPTASTSGGQPTCSSASRTGAGRHSRTSPRRSRTAGRRSASAPTTCSSTSRRRSTASC